jgi:cysteinyl-tRNA synthetase
LKLEEKIDSINLLISNFKITNGVYMPETQTNAVLANINDIDQKIFKNSLQSELSIKLVNEVEKQDSFELLPNDIGIENENINQMVSQFNKIIIEKNNLLVEATEKNPLVIQSQNQLIDLRSNILNSLHIYINKLNMKLNRYEGLKKKSNTNGRCNPNKRSRIK